MVYTENKIDNAKRLLVYSQTILLVDREDDLVFQIENEHLKYTIRFSFSDDGEKFSTQFWENKASRVLIYKLFKWDSPTYVEISKPVVLEDEQYGKFLLKFRIESLENRNQRKFILNIWKPFSHE